MESNLGTMYGSWQDWATISGYLLITVFVMWKVFTTESK